MEVATSEFRILRSKKHAGLFKCPKLLAVSEYWMKNRWRRPLAPDLRATQDILSISYRHQRYDMETSCLILHSNMNYEIWTKGPPRSDWLICSHMPEHTMLLISSATANNLIWIWNHSNSNPRSLTSSNLKPIERQSAKGNYLYHRNHITHLTETSQTVQIYQHYKLFQLPMHLL